MSTWRGCFYPPPVPIPVIPKWEGISPYHPCVAIAMTRNEYSSIYIYIYFVIVGEMMIYDTDVSTNTSREMNDAMFYI